MGSPDHERPADILKSIKLTFETHKPIGELEVAAQNAVARLKLDPKTLSFLTSRLTQILALIDVSYKGNWKEIRTNEALERVSQIYIKNKFIKPNSSRAITPYPLVVDSLCDSTRNPNLSPQTMHGICADAISYTSTGKRHVGFVDDYALGADNSALTGKQIYAHSRVRGTRYF